MKTAIFVTLLSYKKTINTISSGIYIIFPHATLHMPGPSVDNNKQKSKYGILVKAITLTVL
jgi:hypothetical protein